MRKFALKHVIIKNIVLILLLNERMSIFNFGSVGCTFAFLNIQKLSWKCFFSTV